MLPIGMDLLAGNLESEETTTVGALPHRYLGASSCSASSCHGGAGEKRDQYIQWNTKDVHRRSYATLTSARSAQIARAAGLEKPEFNPNCTVCHSPFVHIPPQQQFGDDVNALTVEFPLASIERGYPKRRIGELVPSDGVSCESCHGPSESWIRSHTRPESTGYSHADKVASGMRDLRNPYVRANTCVACHQNVEDRLLKAGHPELIFELDGQCADQPKHWRDPWHWSGPQAWLVGQAVAWREINWQVGGTTNADTRSKSVQAGIAWLVQKSAVSLALAHSSKADFEKNSATVLYADNVAQAVSALSWSNSVSQQLLVQLSMTSADFRSTNVLREVQARRAERLVLGLDRLLAATNLKSAANAETELKELFRLSQILPEFDPLKFADALDRFAAVLN